MMKINRLLLLSKNDIPFEEAQLIIHNPTLKEIAIIGEDAFFMGCEYLNFSKQFLKEQDKNRLKDFTDFEILMTIMKNNDIVIKQGKEAIEMVLALLFPEYQISFLPMSIMLSKDSERFLIDKENFENFRNIVSQMFCLNKTKSGAHKYNPGGVQAMELVKKFQERDKKLAKLKRQGKQDEGITIFSQYISILSVGLKKDINDLLQYTVYQLFEQLQRFKAKQNFDIYVQAKMAGAKDIQDVDNWMSDIHSDTL